MKNNTIKKLKKIAGEKNAQKLLLYFSGDFLDENLEKVFAIPKEIRNIDFSKEENIQKIKKVFSKFEETEKRKEKKEPQKTAKELLDEVGYILDDKIKTYKDYLKYKKYYKEGEELCKFNDKNRCNNYHIFWIIKKDIDKIKREDFIGKEERQDKYGTSCCSISISKNGKSISQICNRYNHKVSAPDNTFNSNLENIAVGLTEAFNHDYGFSLGDNPIVEFDNFYFLDGKYWHYNREINGKKYGETTIDGTIYDPNNFLLFDNFIIDLKKKTIKTADGEEDAFTDIFNKKIKNGAKIIISNNDIEDDDNNIIIVKLKNNETNNK